jgi:hypothetical protein
LRPGVKVPGQASFYTTAIRAASRGVFLRLRSWSLRAGDENEDSSERLSDRDKTPDATSNGKTAPAPVGFWKRGAATVIEWALSADPLGDDSPVRTTITRWRAPPRGPAHPAGTCNTTRATKSRCKGNGCGECSCPEAMGSRNADCGRLVCDSMCEPPSLFSFHNQDEGELWPSGMHLLSVRTRRPSACSKDVHRAPSWLARCW